MRSLSKRKNKQKFFAPVPVFGQLVSLIQQANIDHIIAHSLSDKHSKKMKTKNHLYLMLIAVITRLSSIRELCALILAHKKSLHQMGLAIFLKEALSVMSTNTEIVRCLSVSINIYTNGIVQLFWTACKARY